MCCFWIDCTFFFYSAFYSTEFPPERVPVVLAPLLYGDKQDIHMDRVISDSIAIPKGVVSCYLICRQIQWQFVFLILTYSYGQSYFWQHCNSELCDVSTTTVAVCVNARNFLISIHVLILQPLFNTGNKSKFLLKNEYSTLLLSWSICHHQKTTSK